MPKITIIIPNYNGISFLHACLHSIESQSYTDFCTILVDNGSTDSSISYVNQHFPHVKCISLEKNHGFAYAVNVGIRDADTPFVLLLNSDTVLHPDFLHYMIQEMERSNQIFSVASKMLRADSPQEIDSAGDFYTIMGYAFCRGQGRNTSLYEHSGEIFTACAGAALYRRSVFEQIGYFDNRFFAYLEDVDIGYRARLFGWKNVFCPKATVLHVGGGTSGHGYSPFKVYHSARNNLFLLKKNMLPLQLIINAPFLLAGSALKYAYFSRIGLGNIYLKGLKDGLRKMMHFDLVSDSDLAKKRAWKIQLSLIFHTVSYVKQYIATHLLHS